MDNLQFVILILSLLSVAIANIGLVLWFRSESRNDWKHMDTKVDLILKGITEEIRAIQQEIKDFHGRLCIIEERNRPKG